ncbi:hypothetical protein DK26_01875 [Bosea sp. WAO]|nr:hypothetical protein DK26_01875 [Bosea sp. WAO]
MAVSMDLMGGRPASALLQDGVAASSARPLGRVDDTFVTIVEVRDRIEVTWSEPTIDAECHRCPPAV